jgi:CubicO group peptidase (beta-lactamase class C family)
MAKHALLLLNVIWQLHGQSNQSAFTNAVHVELSRGTFDRIESLSAAEFEKHAVAGVTVGIVSPSGLAWTKSYGLANIEEKVPASRDTVYRIGTITKQFTALMLLQLAERGKVHVSDPVERYFPEVNQIPGKYPNAAPTTLLQLAMNTSGICRDIDDPQSYSQAPLADFEKSLIAALPHAKYTAEPGTQFVYSSFGYAILGMALSRAAGQPYAEYVKQNIFESLGMHHSSFELTPAIRAALASGYVVKDGKADSKKSAEELAGRGYKLPDEAIFTTIDDLAKFMSFEMMGGPESVLTTKTLTNNFSHGYFLFSNFAGGVGVGFQLGRFSDLIIAGHGGGGVTGYRPQAYFRPDARIGIISLRNAEDGFQLNYVLDCLRGLVH